MTDTPNPATLTEGYEAHTASLDVCEAFVAVRAANPKESLRDNTPWATHEEAVKAAVDITATTGEPSFVQKVFVRRKDLAGVIAHERSIVRRRLLGS